MESSRTDEALVCLSALDGRLTVWMKSGDKLPGHLASPVNQRGGRLLIWATVWLNGQSELLIQRNNMNSDGYGDVLGRNILPLSFQLGDSATHWTLKDDLLLHVITGVWRLMRSNLKRVSER